MKKFAIIALLCLTTVAAQAEPWKHRGKIWSCNTVSVTVPGGLKPVVDTDGSLTVENDNLYLNVSALEAESTFDDFEEDYLEELKDEYPDLNLAKPVTKKQGDLTIEMRTGTCTDEGVKMECTLAVYTRGKQSVGVLSIQPLGDKACIKLTNQMLQSLQLKDEPLKSKRPAIS